MRSGRSTLVVLTSRTPNPGRRSIKVPDVRVDPLADEPLADEGPLTLRLVDGRLVVRGSETGLLGSSDPMIDDQRRWTHLARAQQHLDASE